MTMIQSWLVESLQLKWTSTLKLNIPSLLGSRAQSTEAEVKESQTIALVWIHVERAITRIKKSKALNHIPWTLHGSVH